MAVTYTITQNGISNGLSIPQPFTIEVSELNYYDKDGEAHLGLSVCTKNQAGDICENDDLEGLSAPFSGQMKTYPIPVYTSSKHSDLSNSLEVDLELAYPGKWSRN